MSYVTKSKRFADAHIRGEISYLKNYLKWLKDKGVKGMIGETGYPTDTPDNTHKDAPWWQRLCEEYYRTLWEHAPDNIWITHWTASELHTASGYGKYSAYSPLGDGTKPLAQARQPAQIIEKYGSVKSKGRLSGVNIAIGESKFYEPQNTGSWNNNNRGVFDTDYWYPKPASYTYLAGRAHPLGVGYEQPIQLVRLPFRWERIQPTLSTTGGLDATEVTRITASLDGAQTAGIKVVLDLHNYGGYFLYDSVLATGKKRVMGVQYTDVEGATATPLTVDHWINVWRKLVIAFGNHAAVIGYDLMNEPDDPGISSSTWKTWCQQVVDGIRAEETAQGFAAKEIVVRPWQYRPAAWVLANPTPFITDAANKIRYVAHHYWDNAPGFYQRHYSEHLTNSKADGWRA